MPRWPDRCFSYAGLPLTEEDMVKNGANGSAANILKSKAPIKNNQISWARLLAGMGGTQWQMTEGHGWPSRRKRGAEGTLCVGRRWEAPLGD